VKRKPKAVNKPLHYFIVHELDKPGSSTTVSPEVLITALRKVAQGGRYVSASLAERLAMEITTDVDKPLHALLANREYQVLLMLGEGKTVKEIASVLSLSVKTISTYRRRILHKLHLHTTADLIRYVLSQQLLSQPSSRSTLV
jgi:DNA-binding NarL/FixJ family response regulator